MTTFLLGILISAGVSVSLLTIQMFNSLTDEELKILTKVLQENSHKRI